MNYKFKVGDRVKYWRFGKGTIVVADDYNTYGVEFDCSDGVMHSCKGMTKNGHGWWCLENELSPVLSENSPVYPDIHITFNPKKNLTVAKFVDPNINKTLKTCIAKRDPDDAWDSYTGANIAIARLFSKDPQWNSWVESYDMADTVEWQEQISNNRKFVCINTGYGNGKREFTKGKIYEAKDGVMRDDYGSLVNTNTPEFENYFLKIVE